LRPVAHIGN